MMVGMYENSFTWFEAVIVRSSIYDSNDVENEEEIKPERHPHWRKLQCCEDNAWNSDISAAVSTRAHDKIPKVTTAKIQRQCFHPPSVSSVSADHEELGTASFDAWHIQTNIRGSRHTTSHTVSWERGPDLAVDEIEHYKRTGSTLGQGFIAQLMRDDRIAVVARAKVRL